MDLLWITLTSWTTFLSPQHLLCPSPGCPFIIKNSCLSPQFHTWEHSDNQCHQSLEHWGTEQWAREARACPLSRSQPSLQSQTHTALEQLCPGLPWALAQFLAIREIKTQPEIHPSVGEEGFMGLWSCYPLPTSSFECTFPKCQGGWQSWRIRGRGGVSCQKKKGEQKIWERIHDGKEYEEGRNKEVPRISQRHREVQQKTLLQLLPFRQVKMGNLLLQHMVLNCLLSKL